MVSIPSHIKEFVENEGIFVVGTVGGNRLANVSPRVFFKVGDEAIYWLDFFKHKSYRNFQVNPWVTVSVFNKESLKGYQFRGMVSFLTDEPTKSKIIDEIKEKTIARLDSQKIKKMSEKEPIVIQFEPKVCYSLDPEEYSDLSIGSDIDSTSLFQK